MEELFRDYWWLIFPVFGMFMAARGLSDSERRASNVIDLIRTYTDRGQEPPAELLKLAARSLEDKDGDPAGPPQSPRQRKLWQFVVFAGMAAGSGTAYALASRTEDWAWVFLAVAVSAAVIATGALLMFAFGGKS